MSVATEIERLQSAKASIKASIENKGVTVGDVRIDEYANKIDEIQAGGGDDSSNLAIIYTECSEDGRPTKATLNQLLHTSVPTYCFNANWLHALLTEVTLPNGITSVDMYGLSGLKADVIWNDGLTKINTYGCQSATGITTLPPYLNDPGSYAFSGCTGLKFEELPQSLTTIKQSSVFEKCTGLTKVTCYITNMSGTSVFNACTNLERIIFKKSFSTIGAKVFYGCTKLKAVVFEDTPPTTLSNTNAFTNTLIASGTGYIYMPDNLVDSYKSKSNWSTYADQIKPLSEYVEE